MQKIAAFVVFIFFSTLSLQKVDSITSLEFLGLDEVKPRNNGYFLATRDWLKVEKIIWRLATENGMRGWTRRLFVSIIWNESAGIPTVVGDNGCAKGLSQIHVGGFGVKNGVTFKCPNDLRRLLPKDLIRDTNDYMDVELNLKVGIYFYSKLSNEMNPFDALSVYAGCKPNTECARYILGKHLYWLKSGLLERIKDLEKSDDNL